MRRIILFAVLVLAVFMAVLSYWPRPKSQPAATPVTLPAAPAVTPEAEKLKSAIAEIPPLPPAGKIIDPFAIRIFVREKTETAPSTPSPTTPATVEVPPQLEGTWVDASMRIAFISGQALSVGDTILGWRVVSISRDRVVIARGSTTKILKLEEK